MQKSNKLREIPKLDMKHTLDYHRKSNYLELFFDLAFVVALLELSSFLSYNILIHWVISYILIFIPIWWIWVSISIYNNRFETNDISQRIFILIQIIILTFMSMSIDWVFNQTWNYFAIWYILSRFLIAIRWFRAWWHNKLFRWTAKYYIIWSIFSIWFWGLSIFFDWVIKYFLWSVWILFDLIAPIFSAKHQSKLPPLNNSHISERYWLFTLIVLWETLISIIKWTVQNHLFTFDIIYFSTISILIIFWFWRIYFEYISENNIKWWHIYRVIWSYCHLPFFIATSAIWAWVYKILSKSFVDINEVWLIIVWFSIWIWLIFLWIIELTLQPKNSQIPCNKTTWDLIRFWSWISAIILSLFINYINLYLFYFILFLLILFQILYWILIQLWKK